MPNFSDFEKNFNDSKLSDGYIFSLDGQVNLVHLVRLQTDNFHLFLRQQTDKQQTFICTLSKP